MKAIIPFIVVMLVGFAEANAQLTLIDTRFIVVANNGTDYSVKVQIKTNSGTAQLGSSNFVFRFNDNALSIPLSTQTSGPVSGTDYSFHSPFASGLVYDSDVTHNIRQSTSEHELSLNIDYSPGTSGYGTAVGTSWRDFVTINFSVTNQSGNSALSWDTLSYYSPVYGDTTNITTGHWWFKGSWQDLNTTPLPVELISFSAYNQEDHVHLHWATAMELNNFGFEVQRMEEGGDWRPVGFVAGKGTVFYPQFYDWYDWLKDLDTPLSQQQGLRYRLKQMDRDGSYEYSPVVEVSFRPLSELLSVEVYPSPCVDRAVASLRLSDESAVSVSVFDVMGKQVLSILQDKSFTAGSHAVTLPVHQLPQGVYLLRVSGQSGTVTKRFLVGR